MKEISVVIPCYNVEAYIDECVESLVNQTFGIERMELIFVNDASTDATQEKLAVWETKYPDSIIVIQLLENGKQGTARNIGMQYATGEYLGFVDSDDYVDVNMYQKMYDMHQKEDVDYVICGRWNVYSDDTKDRMGPMKDEVLDLTTSKYPNFRIGVKATGGVYQRLYKRKWLMELEVWFPERLAYEDNYFVSIINYYTHKVGLLKEELYYFRVNNNSTTQQKNQLHHLDRLKIELMKLEEYMKRGLYQRYRENIECDFLRLYFANSIRMLVNKFDEVPEGVVKEIQENTRFLFPEWKQNSLLKLTGKDEQLCQLLDYPFKRGDREEVLQASRLIEEKEGGEKILLIKGQSRYDAMRNYIDELAEAFRRWGYHTLVIDMLKRGALKELEAVKNEKFKFVMTFNAITSNQGMKKYLPETIQCTYLCDHPATHSQRICTVDENEFVFVCDEDFKKYINYYFPNIKKCSYIPLSGSFLKENIPYENRSLDLVFTGSYVDPVKRREQALLTLDESMREVGNTILDYIIENSQNTVEKCLEQILGGAGLRELIPNILFHQMVHLFIDVVRFYYRDQILKTIVKAGINIHVFGGGWEEFELSDRENFFHEKGNAYLGLKAVANAKISLNIMPWFKSGFQERIATSMLSGTVALTDSSEYIDKTFQNGEDIVLFSLKELDKLPDIILDLLQDDKKAKRIAEAGKNKARKEHTWFKRAEEILEVVNEFQGGEKKVEIDKLGKEIEITKLKRNIPNLIVDSITELERLIELCCQIRNDSYYTFEDVYKIQQESKRVVSLINQNITKLNIEIFSLGNSPEEIADSIKDADTAGKSIEKYLKNILEHIMSYGNIPFGKQGIEMEKI